MLRHPALAALLPAQLPARSNVWWSAFPALQSLVLAKRAVARVNGML